MKTYIATTALLCSLASAVDLLYDDDLSDNETSAIAMSNSLAFNGFRYTFHEEKQNWKDANKLCKADGGHLVSIRSDDELAAILPLIPLKENGRHRDIQIGLKNRGDKKNEDWEWVDSDDKYSESEAEDLTWDEGYKDEGKGSCAKMVEGENDQMKLRTTGCKGPVLRYICKQPEPNEYTYVAEEKTWEDAEAHCKSLGQHLATVTSEEQQEKVNALIGNNPVWIGLNDRAVEGTFIWSSGVPYKPLYSDWAKREPNNKNGEEHCVVTSTGWNGWNDMNCNSPSHFVCSTLSQPDQYTYVEEEKTWEDAEDHCKSLGQHLATIRSEEEQEKVNALIGDNPAWIGLNDIAVEGTFEWSSGDPSSKYWSPWAK